MKKQIVYVKLIPRLFATTIDLFVLAFTASPMLNIIAPRVFMWVYAPYFKDHNITQLNQQDILNLWLNTPEFLTYVNISTQFLNMFMMLFFTYLVFSIYFIGFWYYYQATPGKILMRMKIVDSESLSTPTLSQIIKRFIGYLLFFVGIWQVSFSERKQALHDKIARTIVIKS